MTEEAYRSALTERGEILLRHKRERILITSCAGEGPAGESIRWATEAETGYAQDASSALDAIELGGMPLRSLLAECRAV